MSKKIPISKDQIRARASTQSFSRGQDYYRDNAIVNPIRRGNTLEAQCYGSMVYRVQVTLTDNGIVSTSCTCPYDWGGDCKHIVALLLTYLHNPDLFMERLPVDQSLERRSKDELISLIRKMINKYPDLQSLVDMPVPTVIGNAVVNTQSIRSNLRRALNTYGGWGDRTAETAVYDAIENAREFEAGSDYANAARIYCAILEECSAVEYPTDDEGEYVVAVNEAVEGLGTCLAASTIAEDDTLRHDILHALLDAVIWDIDFGGIGFGDGAEDLILDYAHRDDIAELRQRIIEVQREKAKNKYVQWGVEAYERMLVQLDALDATDPEETLRRLRDGGMTLLLIEKLLDLDRADDAITAIEEHPMSSHELVRALYILTQHGRDDDAIRIAEERLATEYERSLTGWLIEQYQKRDDTENTYRWQRIRMKQEASHRLYPELIAAARKLNQADDTRTEIIQHLNAEEKFGELTMIHLHDENWDAAWETVEKVATARHGWGWGSHSLKFTVAQQSRHDRPRKAIPVYIDAARQQISQRQRKYYAIAADYLATVEELYDQLDEIDEWEALIEEIRSEFNNLPALQDELNKAGL